ncbi:hypothetical protein BJX61DRAFT_539712 [Aspergillus egyptiacus]|nr:hypothetical protein BJX61DRAFT_539712 [Aspergillus egyptiacus]
MPSFRPSNIFFCDTVDSAVHPADAAQYPISRVKESDANNVEITGAQDPTPPSFQDLVYERDGHDFMLGRSLNPEVHIKAEPAYVIRPSMVQGLGKAEQGSLLFILVAFLSEASVARLKAFLTATAEDGSTLLKNTLLLTPSMHKAFRAGHVDIRTRAAIRMQG